MVSWSFNKNIYIHFNKDIHTVTTDIVKWKNWLKRKNIIKVELIELDLQNIEKGTYN